VIHRTFPFGDSINVYHVKRFGGPQLLPAAVKATPEPLILIGFLLQILNVISTGLSGIRLKEGIERGDAAKQGIFAVKGEGRDEFAPS
jgi:hypothetical protein